MHLPRFPLLAFGAAVVWAAAAHASAPVPDLSVSEWSDKHRYISAESGARFPGPWRTEKVPYTREIMDTMGVNHPARKVFVKAGAQGAKTQCMNNAIGHCIHLAPRSMMLLAPTASKAIDYNREQFQPMVTATEVLKNTVAPIRGKTGEGSTTKHKVFPGGFLKIASANTESDLQSSSIGFLIHEEIASFPLETATTGGGSRGGPIQQARSRQDAWGEEAKEIGASTTAEVGSCVITEEYEAGDQRKYYTPCPQCGSLSELSFDNMKGGELDERGIQQPPYFVQPCCGGIIERADLEGMLVENPLAKIPTDEWPEDWQSFTGAIWLKTYPSKRADNPVPPQVIAPDEVKRWRERTSENRHVSFYFWQGQSPFSNWRTIWQRFEATETDPEKLIAFYQQVLAMAYEPAMDRPKGKVLHEAVSKSAYKQAAQCRRGFIPDWAPLVVATIDTQSNRLEAATWAFGPASYGESSPGVPAISGALVDWEVIEVNPADPTAWAMASQYFNRSWPSDRFRDLVPDARGIDTGGNHTDEAYNAVAKYAGIKALKGSNKQDAPAMEVSKNRTPIRKGEMKGRKVLLYFPGTHNLKKRVYFGLNQGLASMETGQRAPGALFLPPEATEAITSQITAEFLKPALVNRRRSEIWVKPSGVNNEHLDLCVYALALASELGIDRWPLSYWQSLFDARVATDVETPPMEDIWSGNGHVLPDGEAQVEVAKRKTNRMPKKPGTSWTDRIKQLNAGRGGLNS